MPSQTNMLSEAKFFHYVSIGMGTLLLGIVAWIGVNVATIPVIQNQIATLTDSVKVYLIKVDQLDQRLRVVEIRTGGGGDSTRH